MEIHNYSHMAFTSRLNTKKLNEKAYPFVANKNWNVIRYVFEKSTINQNNYCEVIPHYNSSGLPAIKIQRVCHGNITEIGRIYGTACLKLLEYPERVIADVLSRIERISK